MKIEYLALAVARTCGAFDPTTEAFKLNNPGLLKAYSVKHIDDMHNGYRRFASWQAGFKALCFDLTLKCAGESRAGLCTDSPLSSLLNMWEIKEPRKTLLFLQRSLNDETITASTPLEYFK